ncbi:hypothetical protein Ancab_034610 [Ancistrocladus abbreviatus]
MRYPRELLEVVSLVGKRMMSLGLFAAIRVVGAFADGCLGVTSIQAILKPLLAHSISGDGCSSIARVNSPYLMGHRWSKCCLRDCRWNQNSQASDGGNVHLISAAESWEEKLSEANQNGTIVVANFSALWSAPCKVMAPAFHELADKYASVMFLTVDVDKMPEFSTSWDIKATPTFYVLKNGEAVDKLVGANQRELSKKIATILELTSKQS